MRRYKMRVSELLFRVGLAKSVGQGRRLIIQAPVYVDDMRIRQLGEEVSPLPGMSVRVGKLKAIITKQCLKKEIKWTEKFGSEIEKQGFKLTKRGYNEDCSKGVIIACQDAFENKCYIMQIETGENNG